MDIQDKLYCSNCFIELSHSGKCPGCGWEGELGDCDQALGEFSLLQEGLYIIGRVLGIGGFGITYAAFDTHSETMVAIKEYMPGALARRIDCDLSALPGMEEQCREGLTRFAKEWDILSSLTNIKSIVRGLGFFHDNQTSYIVMERLSGADIKALLNQTEKEDVLPLCDMVVRCIGAALVEVHNRGIVHMDVSPANIFFESDGSLKLIDFGSAIYTRDSEQDTVQLKHGYAPPELYALNRPKGPWTDVYALAATYYSLVTGFKVPAAEQRMKSDDLIPLESLDLGVPQYVSDSINKALSLNLDARYRTILEFLHDFNGRPAFLPEAVCYQGPPRQPAPVIIAQSECFGTIRIRLQPGITYKIGRAAGGEFSDFVVSDDLRISKTHLEICSGITPNIFLVKDISINGTFFPNGARLRKNIVYELLPDSVIFLASSECMIKVVIE